MHVLFLNPQVEMAAYQCLSSYLKANGHETSLVNDSKLFDNPWFKNELFSNIFDDEQRILEEIRKAKPDLIGFSVVHDEYLWALKWSQKIKETLGIPIVWGNTYPTFHPEDALKHDCVDYIVRGEGEITLLELVEAMEAKGNLKEVLGLGFKEGNGISRINPMRPLIMDMDILPFPDKDLLYDVAPYMNQGYTTMTGRGCPYQCTFCDNSSSMKLYKESGHRGKWTRRHSPERVIEEILWAKEKYDINHVRFNDEDFSYDRRWIKEFTELYKKKVNLPYFAWVYPNTVNEEVARMLKESGCDSVEMGIQSASERLRIDVMKRRTKDYQIKEAMEALRKNKISTTIDVIIGTPTETKEDLDQTVQLIKEIKPDFQYVFWLRYYPSAPLLAYAKSKNLLTQDEIDYIESGKHSRGHIAGGTELEKNNLSKSYHAFIVLMNIFPAWLISIFQKLNLIQYTPGLNPFVMIQLTRILRSPFMPFTEFSTRIRSMIFWEVKRVLKNYIRFPKKQFKRKARI